jgi:hypothetical protein
VFKKIEMIQKQVLMVMLLQFVNLQRHNKHLNTNVMRFAEKHFVERLAGRSRLLRTL